MHILFVYGGWFCPDGRGCPLIAQTFTFNPNNLFIISKNNLKHKEAGKNLHFEFDMKIKKITYFK